MTCLANIMKVSDVIEQSYIYFIMALRKYFYVVTKNKAWKIQSPKGKKYKGRFRVAPSRDRISFNS